MASNAEFLRSRSFDVPRRLSGVLGALVLAGSATAMLGWILEVERLKDWFDAGISMKPNTALGLMSLGAGLLALSLAGPSHRGPRTTTAAALGVVSATLGGATLVQHLTGWNLGIDTVLFDEAPGARATTAPGRMGPPASVSLCLSGIALLIVSKARIGEGADSSRRLSKRSLVPLLGIAVLGIALLGICGYLFGVKQLYDVPRLTGIALQTAWMIVAVGVALILAAPDREPMRTLAESGPAGMIARRALPMVIVLPLLLGWIRTKGEAAGLYGPGTGRSLLVLSLIACLCGLLWWAVIGIRAGDRARKRQEESLVASEARFRSMLEERTTELRASLERLSAAQRLVALGNLSAGLGHDIANMVLPIRARLEPLKQGLTNEDSLDDVEAITQSLTHLTNLSAGLRLMALDPTRSLMSTAATDLQGWWAEAQGVMRASLPRSVALESRMEPGLGVVMPRHQLTQAVFNLVCNAGEATVGSAAGIVRVTAERIASSERLQRVCIKVIDNGHGLSPDALTHCFEPYFSTRGRSIATGMGLGMVRGLVESAGGEVTVESQPGAGATFSIVLPTTALKSGILPTDPATGMQTAAVGVSDPRIGSFVLMVLEGFGLKVESIPTHAARMPPDADLWVTDDPGNAEIERFLSNDARRRVVLVCPQGETRKELALAMLRLRADSVSSTARPSEIRDVLSVAVGANSAPSPA